MLQGLANPNQQGKTKSQGIKKKLKANNLICVWHYQQIL